MESPNDILMTILLGAVFVSIAIKIFTMRGGLTPSKQAKFDREKYGPAYWPVLIFTAILMPHDVFSKKKKSDIDKDTTS